MIQKRTDCYCAFCKSTRKIYTSKHLNMVGVIGLILFSYLMAYIVWHEADVRGLLVLATLLVIGEGFSQLRWRQSMICKSCGFDPVVYIKDPEKAAEKIQTFLKMRKDNPDFLLRSALNLPIRKILQTEINSNSTQISLGKNLSLRG